MTTYLDSQAARPPHHENTILGWFDYHQRMKPQSNAISPGIFASLAGGIFLGYGFLRLDNFHMYYSFEGSLFMTISWFLSAVVGFIVCGIIYEKSKTKLIYFLSNALILVGGILWTIFKLSYIALIIGRILGGLGYGFGYVTLITHASEVLTPKIRGLVVASCNFGLVGGLLIFGVQSMTAQVWDDFSNDWIEYFHLYIGIAVIVMAAIGILSIIFHRESPVWFLNRKQEMNALRQIMQLQSQTQETWSIRNEFTELKMMVAEDELTTNSIFKDGNLKPLVLLVFVKIALVLSFNGFVNFVRYGNSLIHFQDSGLDYSLLVLFSVRMVAVTVAMLSVDTFGRRKLFFVSSGGASLVLILQSFNLWFILQENFEMVMLILYEIFCGLGLGVVSDIYSAEAFNSRKKAKSVAFISAIEFILQAVLLTILFVMNGDLHYHRESQISILIIFGILLALVTAFLYFKLPETSKMSIRQTRNEFLKNANSMYSDNKFAWGGSVNS